MAHQEGSSNHPITLDGEMSDLDLPASQNLSSSRLCRNASSPVTGPFKEERTSPFSALGSSRTPDLAPLGGIEIPHGLPTPSAASAVPSSYGLHPITPPYDDSGLHRSGLPFPSLRRSSSAPALSEFMAFHSLPTDDAHYSVSTYLDTMLHRSGLPLPAPEPTGFAPTTQFLDMLKELEEQAKVCWENIDAQHEVLHSIQAVRARKRRLEVELAYAQDEEYGLWKKDFELKLEGHHFLTGYMRFQEILKTMRG